MKGHEKILELNSNLSKLIDSLCFQLSVNVPDENSLSLIEILEWKNNGEIDQVEFKQLYCGWLQSKNIYDLFTVRQIQTYPKQQLLQFEGPIKKILTINEITKTLQILNNAYNQIYIQKRIKSISSENPKDQIKNIEQVQKLFSYLDNGGIINLRLSQLFFLAGSVMIVEKKPIAADFQSFKLLFKKILVQLSEINGCVSLRTFKNYFLIQKGRNVSINNISIVLSEIQNLASLTSQIKLRQNCLPNIFQESIQKWKSYPRFKNKSKKVQFLKRIFQQNQKALIFVEQIQPKRIEEYLQIKYGKELLNCLEIDSTLIEQFVRILEDTLNKYINIFQKVFNTSNKTNAQASSQYLNQSSKKNKVTTDFQNSTNKKKLSNLQLEYGEKNSFKTTGKQKTPQKKRKNNHQFTASNNYRNRTPNHKVNTQIYSINRQFGSAQRKNTSNYGGRQTTPTKSTMSFMTDMPRTYRAAQKKGLSQNNFYDKLFFFRNKRVQSYEIVMKRLKNK